MFWFFLFISIAVIITLTAFVLATKDEGFLAGLGAAGFTAFMTGMAAALFIFIGTVISGSIVGHHYEKVGNSELVAINDGSSVSGSFFLGSGYFGEVPSFYYYQKDGNSVTLRHVAASQAEIIETDGRPYIEGNKPVSNNKFWSFKTIDVPMTLTFYVPKGSIVSNFTLDASE